MRPATHPASGSAPTGGSAASSRCAHGPPCLLQATSLPEAKQLSCSITSNIPISGLPGSLCALPRGTRCVNMCRADLPAVPAADEPAGEVVRRRHLGRREVLQRQVPQGGQAASTSSGRRSCCRPRRLMCCGGAVARHCDMNGQQQLAAGQARRPPHDVLHSKRSGTGLVPRLLPCRAACRGPAARRLQPSAASGDMAGPDPLAGERSRGRPVAPHIKYTLLRRSAAGSCSPELKASTLAQPALCMASSRVRLSRW
jgi:hypothetical protein